MASNIHGFLNENFISNYINGKSLGELNDNLQSFITFLFGQKLSKNDKILSDIVQRPFGERKNPKPDIWIKVNNQIKHISLKEGSGNSVHQESFFDFCDFLKSIGVGEEIINDLKLYHFGDDTIDGSGENRYSTVYLKTAYKEKICAVNKELNSTRFLVKILERVLFLGSLKSPICVDACYHGDINNGIWATREEIIDYLVENVNTDMSGIMFSNLTYQPWTRDEKRTAKHPERRLVMQLKWGAMVKDFIRIRKYGQDNK